MNRIMTQKTELGNLGEELACDYLKSKKYKIIDRNYRRPWGEIDIIARSKDKVLVFIEVKTMLGGFGDILRPEDQMSSSKIMKFKKTAQLFAGEKTDLIDPKRGWRLDVVAITLPQNYSEIPRAKLLENCILNNYEDI